MALHSIQKAILDLAEKENLAKLSLRDIGKIVGDPSPQKIKFHLGQLEKKGLITVNKLKNRVTKNIPGWGKGLLSGSKARLYNIPIYGMASCGPNGVIAEQNLEGFLKISNTLLLKKPKESFFAVQAEGNSMNQTSIESKNIESGDYLIVDKDKAPNNDAVVLAIVDDRAVIKRLVNDSPNDQILLISESTENYPPIFIHSKDRFVVNGEVIQVIKQPQT